MAQLRAIAPEREHLWQQLATRQARPSRDAMFAQMRENVPSADDLRAASSPGGPRCIVGKSVRHTSAAVVVRDMLRQRTCSSLACVEIKDGSANSTGRGRKTKTRLGVNYVPPDMSATTQVDDVRASRSIGTVLAEIGRRL